MRVSPDLISIEVVYDKRARDGTWCKLPYPNHPKGCPNFPQCPSKCIDFQTLSNNYEWYACIEEFDLATHSEKMRQKHPAWTELQCRNVLYWQNTVRKKLREKAHNNMEQSDILLEIPEACGINVFATLSQIGIILQRHKLNYVIKTMFIGKSKNQRRLDETTQ